MHCIAIENTFFFKRKYFNFFLIILHKILNFYCYYIQWCAKKMTIFKIEIVSQWLYQLKHTIYHFKAKKL